MYNSGSCGSGHVQKLLHAELISSFELSMVLPLPSQLPHRSY